MKHHQHAKKGHGHHSHDDHNTLHTTARAVMKHKLGHLAKESFTKQGLFGTMFVLEVVNLFYWANLVLDSRSEARRNKGLLKAQELYKKSPHIEELVHSLKANKLLREMFSVAPDGADLKGRVLKNHHYVMKRRLMRLKGLQKKAEWDSDDAIKELKLNVPTRLSEPQIEQFLDYVNERREIMGEFNLLKVSIGQLHDEAHAQQYMKNLEKFTKRLAAFNKTYINSPTANIIQLGHIEAEALEKMEAGKKV